MIEPETIVAQVTPPGRSGVAIIRVSGPEVVNVISALIKKQLTPRYAHHLPIFSDQGEILDQGIIIYFNAPHSFTGEEVLEIQGHGGPVVVDLILKEITALGVRLARPGEFSEQAFLNNKMDLTQAEAVADLINASSKIAVRSALQSLQGEFSRKIQTLLEKIIKLRMFIEAAIDFPEEDVNYLNDNSIDNKLEEILSFFEVIATATQQGRLINEGMTVVIAGKPNAGKSSLLNKLAGEDRAIVTDIPGTTRDTLTEQINIDGMLVNIIDTAGLRETEDVVEREGVARARSEIAKADRVLFIIDDQQKDKADLKENASINNIPPERITIIYNKVDLTKREVKVFKEADHIAITLSAKKGVGLDLLKNHLKETMGFIGETDSVFTARRRHLTALTKTKNHLLDAQRQLNSSRGGELVADDLSQAQKCLGEITGEFYADDLLGQIFSEFCIGK